MDAERARAEAPPSVAFPPKVPTVTNDAMADTQPLRALLRKHVDRAFLTAIAAE
jgi:hypothetical protein